MTKSYNDPHLEACRERYVAMCIVRARAARVPVGDVFTADGRTWDDEALRVRDKVIEELSHTYSRITIARASGLNMTGMSVQSSIVRARNPRYRWLD